MPYFLPSHTTIFQIKITFCVPPLVCATPQFHRLHLCNRVQPCATTMLRAVHAVLQKKEKSVQCEHIWTVHYKSHITQAKMHPPSLESHVITTMGPHFRQSLSHHGRQGCPRCTRVAYNSIAFPAPTRRSMEMICIEDDAGSCIDQASPYELLPPMCPCTELDFPPTQITRREKVSPMEITNGDFAGESTIVVARTMKVHSPLSLRHAQEQCLCRTNGGGVGAQNFLYIAPTAPFTRSVRKLQSPCKSLEMH